MVRRYLDGCQLQERDQQLRDAPGARRHAKNRLVHGSPHPVGDADWLVSENERRGRGIRCRKAADLCGVDRQGWHAETKLNQSTRAREAHEARWIDLDPWLGNWPTSRAGSWKSNGIATPQIKNDAADEKPSPNPHPSRSKPTSLRRASLEKRQPCAPLPL